MALTASLTAAGGISGTVDDSSSHPLQGVDVSVIATSGSIDMSAITNSSGTYQVTGLTPGTYDVCFSALSSSEPTGGSSTSGYLDQCYNNVSWNGSNYDVPSGATAVNVSVGATSGINAALATAGGVTGTVDDASSHPLDGVNVEIYSASGSYGGAATTGPSGTYSVPGLMTGTYDVCFLASTASEPTGGSSTTGYLDQCYNDVSWNGTTSPSGTTAVQVVAGSNTSGINATLATAGGISGTVDDASSHPLDGVDVDVYSASGSEVGGATTGSNGTYAVPGLTTGTYDVCFAASTYDEPTGGSSATGYLDQCYKNVSWDGSTSEASGATAIQVTAGSNTSGINAALASAGAILGTVDDASSHPLDGVYVEVYSASGAAVASANTGSNGTYSVIGLTTGTYDVCFSVSSYSPPTGGSSTTGYLDQCYKNVAWNGAASPSGATAVQVTAGSTTTNINAALAAAGAVSGTVDDASSHPLDGVAVEVYSTSGTEVGGATTGSNGTYSVIGLTTGTYDVCFSVSSYSEPTGGSSTTGYLDQCYNNVTWNGSSSPSGATAVQVTAGSSKTGVNAALAAAGAVSGTVDDASSHPLDGVAVEVYSTSGTEVGSATTGSNGTYSVIGLTTGTYDVCFSASVYEPPTGGSSTTGYGSQCYNGATWDGSSSDISGATACTSPRARRRLASMPRSPTAGSSREPSMTRARTLSME